MIEIGGVLFDVSVLFGAMLDNTVNAFRLLSQSQASLQSLIVQRKVKRAPTSSLN